MSVYFQWHTLQNTELFTTTAATIFHSTGRVSLRAPALHVQTPNSTYWNTVHWCFGLILYNIQPPPSYDQEAMNYIKRKKTTQTAV
jgi:hypothetical protein